MQQRGIEIYSRSLSPSPSSPSLKQLMIVTESLTRGTKFIFSTSQVTYMLDSLIPILFLGYRMKEIKLVIPQGQF